MVAQRAGFAVPLFDGRSTAGWEEITGSSAADSSLVETGPISLQNHAAEAWFRNTKIRVLR